MELFLTAQRSSKEYRLTNTTLEFLRYKSISMEKSKKRCFGFICFLFMAMSVVSNCITNWTAFSPTISIETVDRIYLIGIPLNVQGETEAKKLRSLIDPI
ncbi:hypothetical protein T4E_2673 [Trichinella pseudospiralis]|uniref:Uncharacterized protein n=1 Tax=Trichinella pseudospiralis TaxID=6337 RepID=A0A0V0YEF0_TRIPS|nr:hypothetical protein T4E_2673 [Trichinella pseudospiralis]